MWGSRIFFKMGSTVTTYYQFLFGHFFVFLGLLAQGENSDTTVLSICYWGAAILAGGDFFIVLALVKGFSSRWESRGRLQR